MKQIIGFIYWDNSKVWHGTMFHQSHARLIIEADQEFQTTTGIDPKKNPNIGCQPVFSGESE